MALDTRYIPVIFPQGLFRDKDTGLPLRNGVIYTWVDESRTTPKPLFKISGTPPNYVYTELPNPLDLNSIGSFQDPNTNEDIAPYFFPYDSNEATANIQLYFYEVYSEGGKTSGVLQFTREGQPNLAEEAGPPEQQFENYIPNGQFLSHNDIPALPDGTKEVGEIRAPITVIAQGGWTFERPSGSSAKDFVTFDTFPDTYDNPRFAVRIKNESGGIGDTFKDLRIKFRDVNKFASNTQEYTFAFSATDNDGTGLPIELILIKNFGTGGDSPTERSIATFNIASSYPSPPANPYSAVFTFQLNTGKTIGDLNDDYLQLALRFPVASAFNASLTDFSLAQGAIVITGFPVQTNADTLTRSVAGWMPVPNPDGSDLYLPLKLTQGGLTFDNSCVGDVMSESQTSVYVDSLHPTSNRMLADGKQYETLAYSSLGIPFARLQAKYWNNTLNLPIYGTGLNYAVAYISANSTNQIMLSNNAAGVVTATADGSVATGFSFRAVHTGAATYNVKGYTFPNPLNQSLMVENTFFDPVPGPNPHTSGFFIELLQGGSFILFERFAVECIDATTLAGKYWTFSSTNSVVQTNYYVWYTVNGVGVDPVPGGTAIKVNLNTGDTADIVAEKTREALNAGQCTAIVTVAASAPIPAGAFFTFSTFNGTSEIDYYVWYMINGAGSDPAISNATGIKVILTGSETAAQVATKTQQAINMVNFAVPDYQGLFLRGFEPAEFYDFGPRYSLVPGVVDHMLGTYEDSENKSHFHAFTAPQILTPGSSFPPGSVDILEETTDTQSAGIEESRPRNAYVQFAIIY